MKAERLTCLLIMLMAVMGCKETKSPTEIAGSWLFQFELRDELLPFRAEIVAEQGQFQFYVMNGDERIRADVFETRDDSVFVRLPIFNTALIGKLEGDSINGTYFDYSRSENYHFPFRATRGFETRFPVADTPSVDASGKWKVTFSPGSDNEYAAVGIFEQEGNRAFGTFLTTTGDYRFLEGNVTGDSLLLSCFDGSHAFLFKAKITEEQIRGVFWSGSHWQENWVGVRDESFALPDPTSLTFLKPGFSKVNFKFRNLEGQPVSLSDSAYQNKVVVVQIMGSWCPNCMDETAYLVSLYEKFHGQGLEVISLAFEKSDNEETNIQSLNRLKEHFNIPYEILLAGKASKKEAAEKLPMLNHVLSFPTSIFIDKQGNVRQIHTGFSGPGTGEYYQEFVEETDRFVTQLLIE